MGWGDVLGQSVLVGVVLLGVVVFLLYRRHRRHLAEAHAHLLARDGLLPTDEPCGRTRDELLRLRALPRGDRRYGVEFGVTGAVELETADGPVPAECAAFVWWWEVEHRHHDDGASSVSYSRNDRIIGMLRVPYQLPSVSLAPEGLLTRWGMGGRGDVQVESEEFNRRFDVRAHEPELAIRLLDARFQTFLLELFPDRHVELDGDTIVLAGDPPGEDPSLYGDVSELPGARRDVQFFAARIPASFWRALQHAGRRVADPGRAAG